MQSNICRLSEWKSIPRTAIVTGIVALGCKTPVDGAHEALQRFCEYCAYEGILTASVVQQMHLSWLKVNADELSFPKRVSADGIDLISDGSGLTPLMRMNVLAARLRLNACDVELEYIVEPLSSGVKIAKGVCILRRWDDTVEEPEDQVQRRLHEIDIRDYSSRVPYKLSIGSERFEVSGWDGLVETFVMWVKARFPNGPDRIREIQESDLWKFGDVLSGADSCLLRFSKEPASAVDCTKLMMELLGIDRYSVYVKCASDTPVRIESKGLEDLGSECADSIVESETLFPDNTKGSVSATNETRTDDLVVSTPDQQVTKKGRHFFPVFRTVE